MMERIWKYIAIACALWVVQRIYSALTSPLRTIPGPFYTTLTRLPLKLSIIAGQRIYFIHSLHQRYGPIVRVSPTEVSVVSLPEFREIHRVGSPFLKSNWYEKFVMGQHSLGVFAMSDPKQHGPRRRLFARALSNTELRRVWEGVVRCKVQLAVDRMKGELEADGGRCDVLKWWTFLATDVVGHLMFGEDFDMLNIGVKNEYIHVLESTMKGSGINAELPLVGSVGRHLPFSVVRSMFRANDYLTNYGQKAVTNARANSDSSRNIFSGMLYEAEKCTDSHSGLSELDVITEAGNMIVAGSDTTAVTLTYLVWVVLSRPQLQREIEGEVLALEEGYDDAKLETLPVLNAVIKEALRLYGAAPGSLPRTVPRGGATLGGYFIPEGMTVSTQSWTIHRDENLFPNPDSFNISRWLKENEAGIPAAQLAFSPFGAGARICLGIHLAYMELRLAAAEFFRRCRGVRLAPDTTWKTMKPVNYFLIAPAGNRCEIMRG
ncbi:cytochrome P450 [Aspergillus foveolatus]|uniref:cytochrome P450 n=1 Tax=Aspergillus foveolatus TaxID=210207 RepID=UPI003CCCEACD